MEWADPSHTSTPVVPWLMSAKHGAVENTQQSPAPCLVGRDSAAGTPPPALECLSTLLPGPLWLRGGAGGLRQQGGPRPAHKEGGKAPGIAPLRKERDRGKDRKDTHCCLVTWGFSSQNGEGVGVGLETLNGIVSHCWLGATLCSDPKYPLEVTPQKGTSPKERGQREDPGHPTPLQGEEG